MAGRDRVVLVEHRFHLRVPRDWTIEDVQKYVVEHWTGTQRVLKDHPAHIAADVSGMYTLALNKEAGHGKA